MWRRFKTKINSLCRLGIRYYLCERVAVRTLLFCANWSGIAYVKLCVELPKWSSVRSWNGASEEKQQAEAAAQALAYRRLCCLLLRGLVGITAMGKIRSTVCWPGWWTLLDCSLTPTTKFSLEPSHQLAIVRGTWQSKLFANWWKLGENGISERKPIFEAQKVLLSNCLGWASKS